MLIRRLTATLRTLFYGDVKLANFDNPRCFETIPVYFQIFESIPGWFQHYFWIMWMSKIYRYVFNDWKYTGTISHSWNRTGIFSKLDWLSELWNHTGMISNNRNRSGTFSIFEIVPKNPSTWPVWRQCVHVVITVIWTHHINIDIGLCCYIFNPRIVLNKINAMAIIKNINEIRLTKQKIKALSIDWCKFCATPII